MSRMEHIEQKLMILQFLCPCTTCRFFVKCFLQTICVHDLLCSTWFLAPIVAHVTFVIIPEAAFVLGFSFYTFLYIVHPTLGITNLYKRKNQGSFATIFPAKKYSDKVANIIKLLHILCGKETQLKNVPGLLGTRTVENVRPGGIKRTQVGPDFSLPCSIFDT